jgi:hypothetical protein
LAACFGAAPHSDAPHLGHMHTHMLQATHFGVAWRRGPMLYAWRSTHLPSNLRPRALAFVQTVTYLEGDLNLWGAAWCWWDASEVKLAQLVVVFRHGPLPLKHLQCGTVRHGGKSRPVR